MDTTLLHYTANMISPDFARNIREHLVSINEKRFPIITVSQKPLIFGETIIVGEIGVSTYNIYRQILIGAKTAKTDYIVCCEDDSLYTAEHFLHRPPLDTIAYNINRWNVDGSGVYYYRKRAGMCMCVAPRELLVEVLEKRFKKFPKPLTREEATGWGEPGRMEKRLNLDPVKTEVFETSIPTLTFNHRTSLGGKRKILERDILSEELPHWGRANKLWRNFYG